MIGADSRVNLLVFLGSRRDLFLPEFIKNPVVLLDQMIVIEHDDFVWIILQKSGILSPII